MQPEVLLPPLRFQSRQVTLKEPDLIIPLFDPLFSPVKVSLQLPVVLLRAEQPALQVYSGCIRGRVAGENDFHFNMSLLSLHII